MAPAHRPAQRWSRCMLQLVKGLGLCHCTPVTPLGSVLHPQALTARLPAPVGGAVHGRRRVPRACACTAPGPPPARLRRPPASPSPRPAHACELSVRRRSAVFPTDVRDPPAAGLRPRTACMPTHSRGSRARIDGLSAKIKPARSPACARRARHAWTRGACTGNRAHPARACPRRLPPSAPGLRVGAGYG